ncbi:MAG: hypothetical protein WDZ42_02285 [Candidatus Saccharimonadales bacterium]
MNIRIDEETRRELKKLASDIGIPASSLVNASIRQMVRDRSITLNAGLEPTPYLESIMQEVEAGLRDDKNISPSFDSVDDMFADLEQSAKGK